jgi:zinc transporter 1
MNMQAILLHVLGDALGNVGVIATGLVIWLTSWSFKFYCDPLISLVITAIIFHSALPLGMSSQPVIMFCSNHHPVRSTGFILLQGVPSEISFDQVRKDILAVEGVLSVHELHIWQLSESKIIASVHVTASRRIDFMPVASDIRRVLHQHGVHSSTIQPEYHGENQSNVPDEHLKVRLHFRDGEYF